MTRPRALLSLVIIGFSVTLSSGCNAETDTAQSQAPASQTTTQSDETYDASGDYIQNCQYATCVGLAGLRWSKENPFGVAVGVSMGTKPAVTDDQIKKVLTRDFKHYGVEHIKFFYEQNDAVASVIRLHVRGGVEGPFVISTVRQEVETVAKRALNKNPAMIITE